MMTDSVIELASIVLFNATPAQQAAAERRAERYNLAVVAAASAGELAKRVRGKQCAALLLGDFGCASQQSAKKLRADKTLKNLPIFAVAPDLEIQGKNVELANKLQVELLPASMPEARRWQKIHQSYEECRAGKRRPVVNLRAHFRLPLSVKATVLHAVETVDISLGGVSFLCNLSFAVGDEDKIDIRALLGDSEEDDRGFKFKVVSVKRLKEGEHRFFVGGKFIEMTEAARARLKSALELIEPTGEEND
jgi:hypothetical protein